MTDRSKLQQAERWASEMDSGDWPEDLEPQQVAWMLRYLIAAIMELL